MGQGDDMIAVRPELVLAVGLDVARLLENLNRSSNRYCAHFTNPPLQSQHRALRSLRQIAIMGVMRSDFNFLGYLAVIGLAAIGLLLAAYGTVRLIGDDATADGPREVFEAHLTALDNGDWRLADTYSKDECSVASRRFNDPQAALDKLLASGFSFRRTFVVEEREIWIREDGNKAVLGLDTPPDEVGTVKLDLVEGEWLIAC